MDYNKHTWTDGEIITADKLNNMEQGISDCGAREIEASATASVENTAGTPSCEVQATGSVSSIAFDFAFKGIKGEKGEKGEKGDAGESFAICKTYASVDEMNADADNVEEGNFVLIASDVEDEDNAKLYVKGAGSFVFLTDLSGAQGIKGEKGETGATPLLRKGDSAIQVSYDNGETWADLVQLEDIEGEKGAQGEVAPAITACEINIAGSAVTGKLTLSDESEIAITGTYTAEDEGGDSGDGGDGSEGGGE